MGVMERSKAKGTGTQAAASQQDERWEVETVSGEVLQVQTEGEARWYDETRDAYLQQAGMEDAADLRDMDRLLLMELMIHRWSSALASGVDHTGKAAAAGTLQKNISDYTAQVTKLKSAMGLTKASRAASAGSVGEYISTLLERAKAFGVHRETQGRKAIELLNELFSLVDSYDRSDEEERHKLGLDSPDNILDWVREVARPEYDSIDEDFIQGQQRYWTKM